MVHWITLGRNLLALAVIFGTVSSTCISLGQAPGDTGAPMFQERSFSDRVWESGGPRVNQKHNGKMVLAIEISGNETVSQHKVLSHMQTRTDRIFDEKQLQLDIHDLYRTELFRHIKSEIVEHPDGVVVRLDVREQPMVTEVIFHGNTRLSDNELKKHCGIEPGDPANPFSVEMAQTRLLDLYREKGMNQASIDVLEGNRPDQRRVVLGINEGPVERIWSIHFVGNQLFRSDVLKTKIQSRDSWKGIKPFGNLANRIKMEDDTQALIELYRSLGYFQARVDYRMHYHPSGTWVDVTFVIDEGQQFHVRNISVVGNEYPPFTTELLLGSMELKPGDAFNHARMSKDQRRIRNDFYGRDGFIYVDVAPQAVFLEEPGWLDLVYKIDEGDQYVAGDIHFHTMGDSNHTKRSVPLNLISIVPGQLIDLQELESSERRLKHSQIFETNPTLGEPPRIQVRRGDADSDLDRSGAQAQRPAHNTALAANVQQTSTTSPSADQSGAIRLSPAATVRGQSGNPAGGTLGNAAGSPYGNVPPSSQGWLPSPQSGGYVAPSSPTNSPVVPNAYPASPSVNPLPFASQGATGMAAPSTSSMQNAPGGYGAAVAPGALGGQSTLAPGSMGYAGDPLTGLSVPNITAPNVYQPRVRVAPIDVYLQEARTGRVILGGSVNSDLGVAGQLIIDEKNFDIGAIPRSWSDVFSGYAFRGAGQSFRAELMPGNQVQRYTVNWTTPNLFGYLPYSFSVGGFLFTRAYRDWTEQRAGGRIGLGYAITKDLSINTSITGGNVQVRNPRISGVAALDDVLGKNEIYTGRVGITRDTRDSPFLASEGSLLELIYDQSFGEFDFPQGQINFSHYNTVHERADGLGRHVLVNTWRVGFSGSDTPIFENFFAGGFSSMRGFRFRGASPKENGVQVGGRFQFLGSLEYMFPLTADEMLRGVAFVDYGTVERDITMTKENFRVAPGLGLRISVPMLGPAPLAFDFAVPVAKADGDEKQLLSFFMGWTR